jgi:hypothetical protein
VSGPSKFDGLSAAEKKGPASEEIPPSPHVATDRRRQTPIVTTTAAAIQTNHCSRFIQGFMLVAA